MLKTTFLITIITIYGPRNNNKSSKFITNQMYAFSLSQQKITHSK